MGFEETVPFNNTCFVKDIIDVIKSQESGLDLEHAVVHTLGNIVLFSYNDVGIRIMYVKGLQKFTKHHGRIGWLGPFARGRLRIRGAIFFVTICLHF